MSKAIKSSLFLLCSFFYPALLQASPYLSLAPAQIEIISSADTGKPLMLDLRLGYAYQAHQVELVAMQSTKADSINLLTIDAPSAKSILYRYSSEPYGRLKSYLILGASQIDIRSSYPGSNDVAETYSGASVGIGFEEAFKSIPQLKMKFDWIKLYKGRDLDINSMSLGLRYEF